MATQAYDRVSSAEWRAILAIRYTDPDDLFPRVHGHMLAVWQPMEGSHILVYDASGTTELQTASHDLKTIVDEIMTRTHIVIVDSHFI